MNETRTLNGTWLFRPDPERIGELYLEQLHYSYAMDARWCEPDTDLSAWSPIVVPGVWTRQGHTNVECGWYRLHFAASPQPGHTTLVFDGVDYVADVWLNGHYLGSHEGCFGRFTFDVGDLVQDRNALVVRVDSPWDASGTRHEIGQLKRRFRGALERWDMNDPASKPAGIWGSVSLAYAGPVRIVAASIQATPVRLPPSDQPDAPVAVAGHVAVALHANAAGPARVRYAIRPCDFDASAATGEITVSCRPGERHVDIDFALEDARLWWTWDLGTPRRYSVSLEVMDEVGVSDSYSLTTGFRLLEIGEGWDLRLNGAKLYQRGANYLSDLDLSSMTAERYAGDVALMREANLNTAHPFAVVEGDAFYDACAAAGLMVYQDFPIWMMSDPSSEVVRAATRQFDEMLAQLGHNPAIAIWNFGSQPSVANFEKLCVALVRHARSRDPGRIAHHGNAAISYCSSDDIHPERSFFWAESSALRFEARYGWRRDCHMYPGWYLGTMRAIAEIPAPHFGLVTEFGAQSLPRPETLAAFTEIMTDGIEWRALAHRCAQPELLQRHNPQASTLGALVGSSQRHQAEVVRHDIEFIRARKLDAAGHGLHVFAFNDCWPAVSWSVVEYDRTPKLAYAALKQAMAPVQVFLDDYSDPVISGAVTRNFTVVNDGAQVITGARLVIRLDARDSEEIHDLAPIPASGGLKFSLPVRVEPSSRALYLTLTWAGGTVENDYVLDAEATRPMNPALG